MESIGSDLMNQIVLGMLTLVIPVLVVYAIKYLRQLVQNTEFGKNSKIDDLVFDILEREVETFMMKVKVNSSIEPLDKKVAAKQAIANMTELVKAQGIDIVKRYSKQALDIMLHQAVHFVKSREAILNTVEINNNK